jgi:hypothetical protein
MLKGKLAVTIMGIVLLGLALGSPGFGGKPAPNLLTTADFDDLGVYDGDHRGPFSNGVDGVVCYINAGGGSNDFLLNMGSYGNPTKNPRFMRFDLSHPIDGGVSRSVDLYDVHLNVHKIGTVLLGTMEDRSAGFAMNLDGVTHHLRYGLDPNVDNFDTSQLQVERTSSTTWVIRTTPGNDVARLWKSTNSGEVSLGLYRVPLVIHVAVQ